MVLKFIPSYKGIGEASVHAVAEEAVQKLAEQIADKARQLANAAGEKVFADAIRVETITRPKGRGDVRVIADDESADATEFGTSDTERRRILGQAGGVQINLQGDA